jgi:hypothetical protein
MLDKPSTHTAFALRRENRVSSRYVEIGRARIERDAGGAHHVYLDRLPIAGFSGHVYLSPNGVKPTDPEPEAERPGQDDT